MQGREIDRQRQGDDHNEQQQRDGRRHQPGHALGLRWVATLQLEEQEGERRLASGRKAG